jgi:flagellar basal body-associated protein FliL
MVFCGNCGLQLAPGSTTCPRCRAFNNVQEIMEEPHSNDPTITSQRSNLPPALPGHPAPIYPPSPQLPSQQMVQRPGSSPSQPGNSNADMPTDQLGSQSGYTSAPGFVSPYAGANYSPPGTPIYSGFPGQYVSLEPQAPQGPRRSGRGRAIILILILMLVLLALIGTIVFVMKPDIVRRFIGNTITPTAAPTSIPTTVPTTSTSTPTPSQQAEAVVVQLYHDVNTQDYQDAWNLWGSSYHQSTTYAAYAAGYANTKHDNLTINSVTPNSDGTVTVGVTITATEVSGSSTVTSIYAGTYTVGLENGTWKLLSGSIQKTN